MTKGGDFVNVSNLYRIQQTAEGFGAALDDLAGEQGDQKLAAAMQQLQEDSNKRLSSREVGYLAAMLMAWHDRGSPEIWT